MPGQGRRPIPAQLRPAVFTAEKVFKRTGLELFHHLRRRPPPDMIPIGIIHPLGVFLPTCAMILTAPAGVKQLMGQGLPAAFLWTFSYPCRKLNKVTLSLSLPAPQAGDRPAVDRHVGFDPF